MSNPLSRLYVKFINYKLSGIKFFLLCFLCSNQAFTQVLSENFDNGIPGNWTIVDLGGNTGDTWAGTVGGYNGSYLDGTEFAFVDSDASGNGTKLLEELISPIFDGTPYTGSGLFLTFDQYFRFVGPTDRGYVLVSFSGGWDTLDVNMANSGTWGAPVNKFYNLTPYISNNMQIRFVYDDNNLWAWFWAIDNFNVYSPVTDDVGISAITVPITGGRAGTAQALTSSESVTVEVSNFSNDPLSNIPVSLVFNGNVITTETIVGPIAGASSVTHTFMPTLDLSATGSYLIESYTSYPTDLNPINDSSAAVITQLTNPVVTLPYCESFETMANYTVQHNVVGLPGATVWDFESNMPEKGRIRSQAGPGFPKTGTKALTMDISPSGNVATNFATATLNMSAYDVNVGNDILLSFSYMEHEDEANANDMVWVRGTETDTWISILDWNAETGGVNGTYFTEANFPLGSTLQANGQNFSTTTQIRFGQEDDFSAISTILDDGFTFDDVCLIQQLSNDLAVIDIVNPDYCGNASSYIDVVVVNLGISTQSNVPVNVDISGAFTATISGTLAGPINIGDTMVVSVGPINTISGGLVIIEGTTALGTDQNLGNDTLTIFEEFYAESFPIPNPGNVCPGVSAFATATSQAGVVNRWYDNTNTLAGTGDSLPLGILTADTTVYLTSSVYVKENGGLENRITGGPYAFFDDGLVFDVLNEITLDRVFVYGFGPGDVRVNLFDSVGVLLNSVTVPLQDTSGNKSVIPVGFTIPPGTNYRINADSSTVAALLREDGDATYPYTSTDLVIQSAINNLGGFYYFFYDWQYTTLGCESASIPVTFSILQGSTTVLTNVTCNGYADGSATATASSGTPPYTYNWSNGETTPTAMLLNSGTNYVTITDANGCFIVETVTITEPAAITPTFAITDEVLGGDGAINLTVSGGTAPYAYNWSNNEITEDLTGLTAGNYCVSVTDTNGCQGSMCGTVMPPTAVETINGLQSIQLFPNPTQNTTTLSVVFDHPLQIQLEVTNTLGQTLFLQNFNKAMINKTLDLSHQPTGIYFLTLRSGDKSLTKRLVLTK